MLVGISFPARTSRFSYWWCCFTRPEPYYCYLILLCSLHNPTVIIALVVQKYHVGQLALSSSERIGPYFPFMRHVLVGTKPVHSLTINHRIHSLINSSTHSLIISLFLIFIAGTSFAHKTGFTMPVRILPRPPRVIERPSKKEEASCDTRYNTKMPFYSVRNVWCDQRSSSCCTLSDGKHNNKIIIIIIIMMKFYRHRATSYHCVRSTIPVT